MKRRSIYTVCDICGTRVTTPISRWRKRMGRFCSRPCYNTSRIGRQVLPQVPAEERFWANVEKSEGCWNWTAGKDKDGYGRFTADEKRRMGTHRYSWELHNEPVPPELMVLHKCHNPSCVNPDHLYVGTAKDNSHDMIRDGTRRRGMDCPHAKLSDEEVLDIYHRAWNGPRGINVQLAKEYGVHKRTISNIKRGHTHTWLTGQTRRGSLIELTMK